MTKRLWNIEWHMGKGSQKNQIESLKSEQMMLVTHNRRNGRGWACVEPGEVLKLLDGDKGLYEVILDRRRKVYFDVDSYNRDTLSECLAAISEVLPDAELNVSGSVCKGTLKGDKYSYHIVVGNYYLESLTESAGLKGFCKRHADLGFDYLVYTMNRQMKMINQAKINGPVQAHISGSQLFCDHIISGFFKEDSKSAYDYFEEYTDWREPLVGNRFPQKRISVPLKYKGKLYAHDLIELMPTDVDHQTTFTVALYMRTMNYSFEQFWSWASRKDCSESRAKKWASYHWPLVDQITVNGENKTTEMTMIKILERTYPFIRKEYYTRLFLDYSQFELDLDTKAEYVPNDCLTSRLVDYLIYPMGSGKTQAITSFVNKKPSSTLFLNCRTSLAQNIMGRLNEKFIKYDDLNGLRDLIQKLKNKRYLIKRDAKLIKSEGVPLCDYLVTTPNSVHYIGEERTYHTVVIDEFEMFQTVWTSTETHGGQYYKNWQTVTRLLQKAEKIIIMDAIPSYNTILFLDRIGINRENISIVGSSFAYPTVNVQIIKDLDTNRSGVSLMIKKMIKLLLNNKKIYVFWPYKNPKNPFFLPPLVHTEHIQLNRLSGGELITLLERHVKRPLKSIVYNSDTLKDKALKQGLIHVNETWRDLDIVLVNQSITIGVNFDVPDVFDSVFIGQALFVSNREILQTSKRCRHLSSKTIYYTQLGGQAIKDFDLSIFPKDENLVSTIKDIFNERKANNLTCLRYMFEKANILAKVDEDEWKQLPRLYKKYITRDVSYRYENIELISDPDVYERLCIAGAESCEDFLKLTKYRFRKMFKTETPEWVLASLWENRNLIFRLRAYAKRDDTIVEKIMTKLGLGKYDFDQLPDKINLDDEFKAELIKNLSFSRINPSKSTPSYLVSAMLNCYFGADVYSYQRESSNGTYVTGKLFTTVLEYYENFKGFYNPYGEQGQSKPIECFLDALEDNVLQDETPTYAEDS